ncbi:MAG: imidazole glycerol phosphate synthase subunit HisH [Alphaproteobacteria bacterium]
MSVVIVDYGSGNLRSAAKAFERAADEGGAGARVVVSGDAAKVRAADRVVLPGVGAFADCLAGLAARPGLIDALAHAVIACARPFLGICVGMQLAAARGREHGSHEGLGWIPGEVVPLAPADAALKVPHMGWNELDLRAPDHPLLADIAPDTHMYFVHGYHFACTSDGDVLATADYGGPVTAMVARGNVAGVQFHPEKSQAAGLKLIANFLEWMP